MGAHNNRESVGIDYLIPQLLDGFPDPVSDRRLGKAYANAICKAAGRTAAPATRCKSRPRESFAALAARFQLQTRRWTRE
jgi:hypothetical protein